VEMVRTCEEKNTSSSIKGKIFQERDFHDRGTRGKRENREEGAGRGENACDLGIEGEVLVKHIGCGGKLTQGLDGTERKRMGGKTNC